ncbi:Hsp33 family molecular chaperone HslO [Spiroplasma endosymbiont of Amphibalanus improvisus]|uniref:Hsp33 family molecular chaperone HslO n=1 Tax=Spiroplasma endosymbiont of Amphibalanus improvisus TaxID=3066327 RepID=UPI00313EE3A7
MDRIIEGLYKEHNIKVTLVEGTNTINEMLKIHQPNALSAEVIGRTALATSLIGSSNWDKKTISYVNGGGPIGLISAEFIDGKLKSYCANPNFDDSKIKKDRNVISQVVGTTGTLKVVKDIPGEKEPKIGAIYLVSGEINLDFTYYLIQNENTKGLLLTAIKIDNNKVLKAIGFLANLLPEASEEDLDFLEQKLSDVNLLNEKMLSSKNLDELLNFYKGIELTKDSKISFKCDCSEKKSLNTIKLLDEKDKKEILDLKQEVEIKCDFCLKKYLINYDKIKQVLN